jgi:hypothetical protein
LAFDVHFWIGVALFADSTVFDGVATGGFVFDAVAVEDLAGSVRGVPSSKSWDTFALTVKCIAAFEQND